MAWYDDLSAGIVAIGAALTGIVIGLGGALLKTRRTIVQDNSDIFKSKAERTWIDTAFEQHAETRARLQAALDEHDHDTHTIGQLEAQLGAAKALEEERMRQVGACEERIRSLAEHVLELNMTFDKVYAELARLNPDAAARLSIERWRPPGKGQKPP